MILEKDFEDFVKLLNKYKVDYMIVGGYALALHGIPSKLSQSHCSNLRGSGNWPKPVRCSGRKRLIAARFIVPLLSHTRPLAKPTFI